MDLKLYRPTVPSFQPQQQNLPQRPRDFSNSTPAPMSAFLNFPYENSSDFSWPPPVNGNINNMMNLNNGPPFPRHMTSPPPPPLMSPQFHHNGFGAAPPPPPPQHFSSAGPVGGFQQPPFANGVISPIHSPGLGPVIPLHNNGNIFAPPPPPSYHNIPPPPGSLSNRNQNQMPPPPNFSSFNNPMTGVMHHGSRENGVSHHLGPFLTPPVSAPSSPSPPPPHMINGSAPTQLPPLNFPPSIPRTVVSRTTNKSLTPPLAKSNLATSTVISRNEPTPVSTNNDQPTPSTLKPKFNPNAASFQPVVKSPAIVSSTPPPKRTVTPPAKTRAPFNPLSSRFTPSTCSTPSREEQAEKRTSGKFNPDAPAFVPVSVSPPLPARSSPPPNAPTGPASLVPRTNPPPGSSSIPPYPKLPLSPPTGPKADRNRIPPRPVIGLGIGVGAANEILERGLPATTPLGPKAMSTPTGPRAERPLSRSLSYSRAYSGSEGHNPREKYTKEPAPIPTVALTRIPGIDKPVPTGPAKMLADLPAAAKIPDVPTAPAAMLKSLESGSQNGSDDGSRGRPSYLRRSASYTRSVYIRQWRGGVSRSSLVREHDDSRNVSKSRDGSVIPDIMEIEVTIHDSPNAEDKAAVLTEEPESYENEIAPANEVHENAVQEQIEVPAAVTIEQEIVKEDDESVIIIEGVPFVEEPEAPVAIVELPLEESVQPEVEVIASAEEAESKIAADTAPPVLVQQPVFITDDIAEDTVVPVLDIVTAPGLVQPIFTAGDTAEDTVMPVLAKVEEIASVPTAMIAVAPVTIPIPSIQIEDDSSRKEVDLEKDLDTNFDSFPDSRAATTPSPRLSEISMKKREEEGDEIVSMLIEDGVVIVPTRDTPSPTAQMRAMAKKRLVKDKNTSVEEAPVEEAEKDQKSDEVKPARDGSEILNVRRTKKKGKKAKKEKKNQATPTAELAVDAPSVSSTIAPIAADKPALETDMGTPVSQKPTHRGAVVIHGIVHQDGVGTRAVAVQKNSESGVGFIAESPLPVAPVTEAWDIDAIVLDPKDEEEPVLEKAIQTLMEEAQPEAAKVTLEENDNEKEHDGGVKLDAVDALPPLPEDIEQLVKLTEIYSDSESVRDEQDEEDIPVHDHVEEEPMAEVKPLQVVKTATLAQHIEEEPVMLITPEPKEVIEDIAAIEKESLVTAADEPVADVEEPIVAVEEPVAIAEEPIAVVYIIEEPAVVVQEPVAVVQEPVAVLEEPAAVVQEPVAVLEEPIVVVEEAVAIVEEAVAIVEEAVAIVEEPIAVVMEPTVIVEEPIFVVQEPVVVVEEPIVIVEEPVAVAEEPTAVVMEPAVTSEVTSEESPVVIELLEDLLVPAAEPSSVEEVVKEAAFFEPRHMHTGEIAVSINSIIDALASCKDINSLSGTLETYSRVSKPGTQEERLFRELHHYAAIADPTKKDNSDNRSTRSKSSMRSVRSFFKRRAEAYPQLLSSTTNRIKAILPPFLSMTAAPAINTIPTSGTITPTDRKSPMASTTAAKSQRSRLLPKMTMSLLSRSFSTKSQQNVVA